MGDELPVLVAAVAHEQARELDDASRVGRHVWVQLKWPPGGSGPHLLEVYTPTSREPLRLLAEPLGSSSEKGYALRIYPWEEAESEVLHHADVEVPGDRFVGRALANGRFEIFALLGEGSIGAVYRARHTGLGIVVAVKVLHETFQRDAAFCQRFYDEALALSRLDHPNLVHVYDFGQEDDGLLYISMALVEGVTLRTSFAREKKAFDTKRMVSVMLQVAAGLGHAHERGLIHRDVKPDNVMLTQKEDDDGLRVENVKVLDFGFAVPPSASSDVAQRLAGTPVYMSPEQCLGQELDARSDVYACGVMIYELMTGTVPFLGRTAEEIRQKHIDTPPPSILERNQTVDPRIDRLVQKAMAKSRSDRHPSMQELRADLKRLLLPEGAAMTGHPRATGSSERRSFPPSPSPRLSRPVLEAVRGSRSGIPAALDDAVPALRSVPPLSRASLPDFGSASGIPSAPGSRPNPPASKATSVDNTTADAIVRDPGNWLAELTREQDPSAFTARFAELDGAVRVLAGRGDLRVLRVLAVVTSSLAERLGRLTKSDAGAGAAIASLAKLFRDPEMLSMIATSLLVATDENRKAGAELIRPAGVAGAYALFGARAALASASPQARIAFVTTMKGLGEPSLPVVRAGLERIFVTAENGSDRGHVDLAEDLLLSMPAAHDEVAGHLVVKYAASPVGNLCRAAARALPRVWGDRARQTLLGLVDHEEDGVRVAAIVGLREIRAVDVVAMKLIGALFRDDTPRSAQLVAAAVSAAQTATPEAKELADALLRRL